MLHEQDQKRLAEMAKKLYPEFRYHQMEGEYIQMGASPHLSAKISWKSMHYLNFLIAGAPKRLSTLGGKNREWLKGLIQTAVYAVAIDNEESLSTLIDILYNEYSKLPNKTPQEALTTLIDHS